MEARTFQYVNRFDLIRMAPDRFNARCEWQWIHCIKILKHQHHVRVCLDCNMRSRLFALQIKCTLTLNRMFYHLGQPKFSNCGLRKCHRTSYGMSFPNLVTSIASCMFNYLDSCWKDVLRWCDQCSQPYFRGFNPHAWFQTNTDVVIIYAPRRSALCLVWRDIDGQWPGNNWMNRGNPIGRKSSPFKSHLWACFCNFIADFWNNRINQQAKFEWGFGWQESHVQKFSETGNEWKDRPFGPYQEPRNERSDTSIDQLFQITRHASINPPAISSDEMLPFFRILLQNFEMFQQPSWHLLSPLHAKLDTSSSEF